MSTGRRMFHNLRAYLKSTVSTACGRSMDLASSKVELMGYRPLRFSWTEIQPILACSQTLCAQSQLVAALTVLRSRTAPNDKADGPPTLSARGFSVRRGVSILLSVIGLGRMRQENSGAK